MAYRMRYQRVALAPGIDVTLLLGLPAVPPFIDQFSPFALPLLLGTLVMVLLAAIVVTLVLQQVVGPAELGVATKRKRHVPLWFVLGVGFTMALSAAYAIDKLHESVNQGHNAEVVLVRIEGLSRSLNALD